MDTYADPTIGTSEPPESGGIVIIGAGIAGLSLALCLRRRGYEPTLIEQTSAFANVGAGLQLAPNATRLLARIGLLDDIADAGVELECRVVMDQQGTKLAVEQLGAVARERYDAPYLAVHRASLQQVLADAVGPDAISFGDPVDSIRPLARGVHTVRRSGLQQRHRLVVGADGIRSTTRRLISDDAPTPTGHSVYRALLDMDSAGSVDDRDVRVWIGGDRHCVVYPIGNGQVNVVAAVPSTDTGSESWSEPGDPQRLVSHFEGWDPTLTELLGRVSATTVWGIHDRDPIEHWSTQCVTLIGDAAHPMAPFLAQGANQAIEDSFALAACLWAVSSNDLPMALESYERVRVPRSNDVLRRSRRGVAAAVNEHDAEAAHSLAHLDWLYGYDAELAAVSAVFGVEESA